MKHLLTLIIFLFTFALISCFSVTATSMNQTYTIDEDFDNGTMAGLEHNTTHNQLQISNPPTTIPFIWVPNSNEGTVSKVDTRTGNELGRYRVSPYSYSSPSRTTVDLQGNCWVANRQTGTAVKIGLYENGGYIDRNLNGIIETSRDLNDDGIISEAEMLAWGADECVLYDIILIPGKEATYAPGQYTGSYANDNWNPGTRGVAVDAQNNIWLGTYSTMKFYYINGSNGQILKTIDVSAVGHTSYGFIIDENGILWSSGHDKNHILRLDPKTNSFTKVNVGHFVYGLGIDRNNHLFASGWTDSKLTRINTLTGAVEWTKSCPTQSRGITVTDDGDVWVANSLAGTVTRYSNEGVVKATISVGSTPTGLSMDADSKVWIVNYGDEYIKRINPATNSIELSKKIPGGLHYGYSDMTGAISRTITTKLGTWLLTHDSEVNNVPWGIISWNSFVPTGTSLKIEARSSNDKINWSEWEEVQNGVPLSSTTPGRYLQILATFQILSGRTSPILYDLTVTANATDLSVTIIDNPDPVTAGEDITYNITVKNQGLIDALNTVITDNISFLDNIRYSLNGIDWNNWTGSLNLGTLLAGSSKWLMIRGRTRSEATGTLTNTVTVNSDTFDINSTNNAATVSTTVTANSDVYVTINDNPDPVVAGENLTYTVNVGNNGPSNAQNVVLAGNLPLSGLEYSRDSGITWNIWNGSINLGNVVSGNLETILVRGKVASSTLGTLTGTATVKSDTTDANTQNNIFSENTIINTLADLSIIGTDNPDPVIAGENLIYSITVSNNGPSDALNVTLTGNTALENIEYSLDNGNTWIASLNIGTIITGDSKTVLIRGKVPSSALGSFTSTFTVNSSTSDPNLVNNAFTESTSVNTRADLSVTMIDNLDPVSAGAELTYTINVSNLGPSDARNAILSDIFPLQLQNIQYSLDNGTTWVNWTGSLNLGTLSVNSSKSVLIKGKIPSSTPDGSITNTASVSSDTLDLNTANNVCSETTILNTRADLSIKIADSQDPVIIGNKLNYAVLVANNGPSNVLNVKLTGVIPLQDVIFSLDKGITWKVWNSSLNIGNITSGNSKLILISGKVPHSAPSTLNCTLSVNSNIIDPNIQNNIASELTTVTTKVEVNQVINDIKKGDSSCGPDALSIALLKVGIGVNAEYVALIAGTNTAGTSFYGLVQAAENLGLNLTGLKLDAGQLKPNDIVLLNLNGTGHYSVILSITNNSLILLDPTFGIVTISNVDFLKLYNSYALTLNPDGRGITLTAEEMNNLVGSVGEEVVGSLLAVGVATLPEGVGIFLIAAAVLLAGGIGLYKANEHYANKYPSLNKPLPSYAPPFYRISMGVALDIVSWAAYRKPENPYEPPVFSDPNKDKNIGSFAGKLWVKCDDLPIPLNYGCKGSALLIAGTGILAATLIKLGFTPDKIIDSVFNIPNKIFEWINGSSNNNSNNSSFPFNFTFNNTSKITSQNPKLMMINAPGIINGIINGAYKLGGLISSGINGIVDGVKTVVKTVGTVVSNVAKTISKTTKIIGTAVSNVAKNISKKVITTVNKVVTKAKTVAKKAITTVKKTVKKLVTTVKKVVTKTVNTVKKAVSSAVNWVKNKIKWPW